MTKGELWTTDAELTPSLPFPATPDTRITNSADTPTFAAPVAERDVRSREPSLRLPSLPPPAASPSLYHQHSLEHHSLQPSTSTQQPPHTPPLASQYLDLRLPCPASFLVVSLSTSFTVTIELLPQVSLHSINFHRRFSSVQTTFTIPVLLSQLSLYSTSLAVSSVPGPPSTQPPAYSELIAFLLRLFR